MSNFLAVGGVSATLQTLLRDRMELPQGMVRSDLEVTVGVPLTDEADQAQPTRVNLFLYRVTENGFLKNQMIPGQGHPSEYGHPPLSLVLHYLMTAYGATDDNGLVNETRAHFLLGSAMRVLHDHAEVTERLRTEQPPVGATILHESLRGEFERVKLCLDPISLEDLSKVWTALTRPFRVSAAYTVSAVQIESRRVKTLPAPVLTRRIHVAITQRPQITAAYRTPSAPGDPIGDIRAHIGDELTIEGANFLSDSTYVKLGGLEPIGVTPDHDRQIRIIVPDDTYPADQDHALPRPIPIDARLRPGALPIEVQALRRTEVVEGGLDAGVVALDDRLQLSNQSVFLFLPEVTTVSPVSGGPGAILTVNGRRLFRPGVKGVILVGDVSIPIRPPEPGELFAAPTDTSVQVPLISMGETIPPTVPGVYNVHAMVNGAQSMETVTFQLT
jgi:hypothetical protein